MRWQSMKLTCLLWCKCRMQAGPRSHHRGCMLPPPAENKQGPSCLLPKPGEVIETEKATQLLKTAAAPDPLFTGAA